MAAGQPARRDRAQAGGPPAATCDTMPCGICRQFLCEFIAPDAPVYTVARNGDYMVKTFAEIMPFAFTSFKKD